MDLASLWTRALYSLPNSLRFRYNTSLTTKIDVPNSSWLTSLKVENLKGPALVRVSLRGGALASPLFFSLDSDNASFALQPLFERLVARGYTLSPDGFVLGELPPFMIRVQVTDFSSYGSIDIRSSYTPLLGLLPSLVGKRYCRRYYVSQSIRTLLLHWFPEFDSRVVDVHTQVPGYRPERATDYFEAAEEGSFVPGELTKPMAVSFRSNVFWGRPSGSCITVRSNDKAIFDIVYAPRLRAKLLFVNSRHVYDELAFWGKVVFRPASCDLSLVDTGDGRVHVGSLRDYDLTIELETGVLAWDETLALFDFVSCVGSGVLYCIPPTEYNVCKFDVALSGTNDIDVDLSHREPRSYTLTLRKI